MEVELSEALREIAVCFATINRPYAAQRLIKSIRRYLGKVPIYVADQSTPNKHLEDFYAENSVNVTWMPFDSGVTASRNAITSRVREKFFLLCDDDFIMIEQNGISGAIEILEAEENLGIIGGRLKDYWNGAYYDRYWELFFNIDRKHRIFEATPIYVATPISTLVGKYRYFHCDAVMNWFVARTEVVKDGFGWDEQFKSNGEHEDFFLNLKLNSNWRVGYLPSLLAKHRPPEIMQYAKLRSRTDGWLRFMDKWNIDQMFEIGGYVRTRANPGKDIAGEQPRASFFMSRDLTRDRDWLTAKELLSVNGFDRLGVFRSNLYDEVGNSNPVITSSGVINLAGDLGISAFRTKIDGLPPQVSDLRADKASFSHLTSVAIPTSIGDAEDLPAWVIGKPLDQGATAYWFTDAGHLIAVTNFELSSQCDGNWRSLAIPVPHGVGSKVIVKIGFDTGGDHRIIASGRISILPSFSVKEDVGSPDEANFTYSLPVLLIQESSALRASELADGWSLIFDQEQGNMLKLETHKLLRGGALFITAMTGKHEWAFAFSCPPIDSASFIALPKGVDALKKVAILPYNAIDGRA